MDGRGQRRLTGAPWNDDEPCSLHKFSGKCYACDLEEGVGENTDDGRVKTVPEIKVGRFGIGQRLWVRNMPTAILLGLASKSAN